MFRFSSQFSISACYKYLTCFPSVQLLVRLPPPSQISMRICFVVRASRRNAFATVGFIVADASPPLELLDEPKYLSTDKVLNIEVATSTASSP